MSRRSWCHPHGQREQLLFSTPWIVAQPVSGPVGSINYIRDGSERIRPSHKQRNVKKRTVSNREWRRWNRQLKRQGRLDRTAAITDRTGSDWWENWIVAQERRPAMDTGSSIEARDAPAPAAQPWTCRPRAQQRTYRRQRRTQGRPQRHGQATSRTQSRSYLYWVTAFSFGSERIDYELGLWNRVDLSKLIG